MPLFWGGGGVVPLAGGGPLGLGLVLGGGGGGFCSGAPPGCELGALAGGGACSLDGGLFGVVVSLGGEFADPPGLFDCWREQAPAESASAATHSNNKLRFIWITSQRKSPDGGAASQAAFHLRPGGLPGDSPAAVAISWLWLASSSLPGPWPVTCRRSPCRSSPAGIAGHPCPCTVSKIVAAGRARSLPEHSSSQRSHATPRVRLDSGLANPGQLLEGADLPDGRI